MMEIRFYVIGAERKAFVAAVSELVGWEAVYKKAPTFAYVVNNYTIDKNGALIFDERTDMGEAARLLEGLALRGYVSGDSLPNAPASEEADPALGETEDVSEIADPPASDMLESDTPDRLSVELPLEGFTDLALSNLKKLVASKAGLIRASIGAEELPIVREDERICFPWFAPDSSPEEVVAYTQLVTALCAMAKEQTRIVATERAVDNPKYAMRCFLLRLGFIGDEYAAARKLLLRNLSGNGSFKGGAKRERPADSAPNLAASAPDTECVVSAGDADISPENAPTGGDNGLAEALADAALLYEVNASFVGGNGE